MFMCCRSDMESDEGQEEASLPNHRGDSAAPSSVPEGPAFPGTTLGTDEGPGGLGDNGQHSAGEAGQQRKSLGIAELGSPAVHATEARMYPDMGEEGSLEHKRVGGAAAAAAAAASSTAATPGADADPLTLMRHLEELKRDFAARDMSRRAAAAATASAL